jgi:hypothetical protein
VSKKTLEHSLVIQAKIEGISHKTLLEREDRKRLLFQEKKHEGLRSGIVWHGTVLLDPDAESLIIN